MKRFLPLLILTGLLFGQESTIVLKDGKTIKGTIVSEEEYEYTVQVVKVYGYSRYEKIKILKSDIVTIESEINTTQEEDKGTNIDSDRQKLFVQDVLLHKSGEVYKGRYITKENDVIIFRLEGEKNISMFSINDVDIVITSRGGIKVELYYPFDIPTKQEEDVSRILDYRPKSKIGQAIYGRFVLGMGVSCVMVLAILLALALGLPHPGM